MEPSATSGIRSKRARALLVIDMVPRLVYGGDAPAVPGAAELIRYIQGEVRYFRERDRTVVFVVSAREGGQESIIADLTPRAGELVIAKPHFSAFFGTDLEAHLREKGSGRVTLTGIGTATSVLLTAADALARGFGVSVPDPCVCDRSADDHAFALHLIRDRLAPDEGGASEELTSPGVAPPEAPLRGG